jgi:pimeloyl-ACP methyl ester carboxylesterase
MRERAIAIAGLRRLLAGVLLVLLACTSEPTAVSAPPRDLVVLVHGMGRSSLSMIPLERALEREGFDVLNWNYSSTRHDVAELAELLGTAVRERPRPDGARVHFVTHSLGGIVVRAALASEMPSGMGRVVMLAPPNAGARAADLAEPWVGWLLKPISQIGTGEDSVARDLVTPAGVEIGVIAGELDAKVSVEETHLPGETDHVVVQAWHSFLMNRQDVQEMTTRFLRDGRFEAGSEP